MRFHKRTFPTSLLLAALAAAPSAHALDKFAGHDEACRTGAYNPLVGIWKGTLDFSIYGPATVLVSVNQGGTFTETDSIDLNGTVGTPSPGYAAWKAKDCRHYDITINKMTFNSLVQQFYNVVLPGTIVLSEDGQSWTVSLNQEIFDVNGNLVGTGTVTGTTQRVKGGNGE